MSKTWIIVDHDDNDKKVAGPFKTRKAAEIERQRLERRPCEEDCLTNYWIISTPRKEIT